MSRSFMKVLAGAAMLAVMSAEAQAQTCTRINGTNAGTCTITSSLTIVGLASVTVGATTATFDAPDWALLLSDTTTVRYSTIPSSIAITFRSNAGIGVAIRADALTGVPSGGTRDNTDYGFRFITSAGSCPAAPTSYTAFTGADQPIETLASLSTTAPNSATGNLCLYAKFDPAVQDKIRPATYQLPVRFVLSAP